MMVRPSVGTGDLLLATREGLAIRFSEDEVRTTGRTAKGVRGIEVGKTDELVTALAPRRDSELLVVGADGLGKRVPFTELKRQGRAGKGMALLPDTDRAGLLVGVLAVHPGDLGMCELESGEVVPISVDSLPVKPRRGASVRIDALSERTGPIVALHPLRASSGEEPAEIEDGESDAAVEDPGADLDTGAVSPGETQAELEL
jgi:DNA gyrase subunit A